MLVLVVPGEDGAARVVLTERPIYDGLHSGEVSFPGGKVEPGDVDDRGDRAARGAPRRSASTRRPPASGSSAGSTRSGSRSAGSRSSRSWRSPSAARPSRPRRTRWPGSSSRRWRRSCPGRRSEIVERTIRDWPLRYGAYRADDGAELLVWGATARILGQLGALVGGD